VDAGNGEWEFTALLPQQARQSAPHVAVSDDGELHSGLCHFTKEEDGSQ
jgi:hypothetical protein